MRARNHKKPSALEMAHCIFPSEPDSFVNVPPNVEAAGARGWWLAKKWRFSRVRCVAGLCGLHFHNFAYG